MGEIAGVILAAGLGKRMRSKYPKVLHPVGGKPMLQHVLEAAEKAGVNDILVVLGHGRDMVLDEFEDISYVVQEQQLGTGHALYQCRDALKPSVEHVLVLCGDAPLIKPETLKKLIDYHVENKSYATVLTAEIPNPEGYGRIIRDDAGNVRGIVEHRDASPKELEIKEVNSGTYVFSRRELFEALEKIDTQNAQGEYYLTDVIGIFFDEGKKVSALMTEDPTEIMGINDRIQLAEADRIMRLRKNEELMLSGVTILDPETTKIDSGVVIAPDTVIYPFTIIEGNTEIGEDCRIGPFTTIVDCVVGRDTVIRNSVVLESRIGSHCKVGPFAHIRPETVLKDYVKVGDFVEIKKSKIGEGSKVPHLSYVGDAEIEENVNIGAGTITCNYDGERKWKTFIDEGAFIGSNTSLVAPVKIGKRAFVAAGSTITRDVPKEALAIAREKQKNIEGWVRKKKKKDDD
ncbi:MAG: Bifunctional protein GlmU [Clostridia bacterium 41_269]|nr:MAG: Bifunctional protein GlmU [Clostridia bacterium 41_269]